MTEEKKVFSICEYCGTQHKNNRDKENHEKTKKHINNMLDVCPSKCDFCDYTTDRKSNLKRHNDTIHNNIILPKIEVCTEYPIYLLKKLLTMKASENTKHMFILSLKKKITKMVDRQFKEDEPTLLEARNALKVACLELEGISKKIKDVLTKYPTLEAKLEETLKEQRSEQHKREEAEIIRLLNEVDKEREEDEMKEEKRKERLIKIESIKEEISNNISLYVVSKWTDKTLMEKNKMLERELSLL